MNNFPLITVVIPVYNRETYIKQCIEQVLCQDYKNIEIIVVNDGSSDSSKSIIEQFDNVQLINHEVNKGLSAARNTGIKFAKGKYIHFLDDDDIINQSFYTSLVEASEKYNADISCCSFTKEGQLAYSQIYFKQQVFSSTQEKMLGTFVVRSSYVWRFLFRLDLIKDNNLWFEEGRLMEDIYFSVRAVFFANKVVVEPKAQFWYTFTPNSIINNKNTEHRIRLEQDGIHAVNSVKKFAKKHNNFALSGLTSNRIRYFLRRLKLGIYCACKYRDLKALKL